MAGRKHAGCAAAEVDGPGFLLQRSDAIAGLGGDRVHKFPDRSGAGGVLVKGAIRANPVAERDMEIEQQGSGRGDRFGNAGDVAGGGFADERGRVGFRFCKGGHEPWK